MAARRVLLNGSFAPSVVNFRGALIRDVIKAGWDVHVSVPDLTIHQRREIASLGATVHEVPLQRTGTHVAADLRYYREIKRLISALNPDLVVGYTIKPNIWGSLAAANSGVRSASMVTGLGYTFVQRGTLKQRLIAATSRLLYRRATEANNVVVFQNRDDREDFIAAGCLANPAKARVVNGSGVDLTHFEPAPLPAQPVFLMVARLLVSKGVREYAEAALHTLSHRRDCRFLLAGNLDDSPDCIGKQELEAWCQGGIEYLGWVQDVRVPLRMASVFVLPSYREGTPRTALEASAMGRPVITSDAPGCRETVLHNRTGKLVASRDSDALAIAMQTLADSPELRRWMGSNARVFCAEKYNVVDVNKALMKHLEIV